MKNKLKYMAAAMILCLGFTACSDSSDTNNTVQEQTATEREDGSENSGDYKVFNYGTTAYGEAMGNGGLDPHNSYMGWSTVRYGVGETLFRFSENMELEPWIASGYEQVTDNTVVIEIKDNIYFSNGEKVTGEKVKLCLERLIDIHDRAPGDLGIDTIEAEGQSVRITTELPSPALLNYLSDPYGAIIDVEAGVDEDYNVFGTGPYKAVEVSPSGIKLAVNEHYWGEMPSVDEVHVISITDGDTLTMALQSGEIDAAQGLPYASLEIFKNNDNYKISSSDTSRLYQVAYNFNSEVLADIHVRRAIAMALDKESFTSVLLNGNGSSATGAFPENFAFGKNQVEDYPYDVEGAKALLSEAGWTDTDGDGYVDKDGKNLEIRWLTYTSRQELPLLAEYAQAALGEIGIAVDVNATDNHGDFLERGEFEIYASAFVAAPTGDPQYYFTTHTLESSAYNRGAYFSENMEALMEEMKVAFDQDKRSELAIAMQQQVIEDCSYIFVSHLRMSFVMKEGVIGFEAHPSDYYEITSKLDIN